MNGFLTLFYKELLRFWKVGFQTVFAPMLSTLLYLLIFSHVLEERTQVYPSVTYTVFLIPGLVIMAMLQNAFANSSSSLIQSTVSGNHIFMLLSPLSYQEIFTAYVLASVVRGLIVGLGIYVVAVVFFELPLYSFAWIIAFALMGTALLCDPATDVLIGCFLHNLFVAFILARIILSESVFLHGRRVPLRFLSRLGCFTLPQPWDSDSVFPGSIVVDTANAESRVQNTKMMC